MSLVPILPVFAAAVVAAAGSAVREVILRRRAQKALDVRLIHEHIAENTDIDSTEPHVEPRAEPRAEPLYLEYNPEPEPVYKVLGVEQGQCMLGSSASVNVQGDYTFQWQRASPSDKLIMENIEGATSSTYTYQLEDVNYVIAVRCIPAKGAATTAVLNGAMPVRVDPALSKKAKLAHVVCFKVGVCGMKKTQLCVLGPKYVMIGSDGTKPICQEKYKIHPQSMEMLPNEKEAVFTIHRPSTTDSVSLRFVSKKERDLAVLVWHHFYQAALLRDTNSFSNKLRTSMSWKKGIHSLPTTPTKNSNPTKSPMKGSSPQLIQVNAVAAYH